MLIPGLQGRWEFHEATVHALSAGARVLTFSLDDVPQDRASRDDQLIDGYRGAIEQVLDGAQVERAAICGISYGGLPALRFAATRPDRTSSLVLASTPGPGFHLKARHAMYARWPRLFGPVFAIETPRRLAPEIRSAFADRAKRRRFRLNQLKTVLTAPVSFPAMAARARSIETSDSVSDAGRVSSPALILVGDQDLDAVVNPESTIALASHICGARLETLSRTGHLGSMTHAAAFAALVLPFIGKAHSNSHDSAA